MIWAQRLVGVFRIDVSCRERCGGPTRVIAALRDPVERRRVLTACGGAGLHGPARGPPQGELALG
jgi:hypothetical protein